MNHQPISDVQSTNLQLLQAIIIGAERDMAGTCHRYHLNANLAERLRGKNAADIVTLVRSIGETSLFVPRQDLATLIDSPAGLAGTLAAAFPRTASASASPTITS